MPGSRWKHIAVGLIAGGLQAGLSAGCSADPPDEFSGPAATPTPTNPSGVAYPTDNIGTRPRSGRVRGQRIANLAFNGYEGSDRARGLTSISLARYYDPRAERIKLLWIQGIASWCSICRGEASALLPMQDTLKSRGVAVLVVMVNGDTNGLGPSLPELDRWLVRYPMTFDSALDVRGQQLGPLGLSGVPFNVLVDPRTMELLYAGSGAPQSIDTFAQVGLDFVSKAEPSY
jgi:hypothetical protein